jgi:hypothetical protein
MKPIALFGVVGQSDDRLPVATTTVPSGAMVM